MCKIFRNWRGYFMEELLKTEVSNGQETYFVQKNDLYVLWRHELWYIYFTKTHMKRSSQFFKTYILFGLSIKIIIFFIINMILVICLTNKDYDIIFHKRSSIYIHHQKLYFNLQCMLRLVLQCTYMLLKINTIKSNDSNLWRLQNYFIKLFYIYFLY